MGGERQAKPMSEERTVAASYLLNFYQDFQMLAHHYAQYLNIMLEAQYKYGEEALKKMNDEEKQTILMSAQNLRYYVNKTYVAYCGIMPNLPGKERKKEPEQDKLKAHKESVNGLLIIKREDAEKYLIELNAFIATDIMKSLLQDSEGIVTGLYAS